MCACRIATQLNPSPKRGFFEGAFATPLRATVRMKLDELTLVRVLDPLVSPGVAFIAARDV
jgi:hypothetical protein